MSQEASSRLYLAVLLRRRPLLCEGVVMGLNCSRFLDVYIPDIGIELRIQVEDIVPAPVYGDWDDKAKCVYPASITVTHSPSLILCSVTSP